ncbi:MAG: hypothetical protein O3C67_08920, partial [Cyanobacteria bacterium]|nr:hypothetical protein [Cyanobacteriota bacterium]
DRWRSPSGIANSLSRSVGKDGIRLDGCSLSVPMPLVDDALVNALQNASPLLEDESTQVEPAPPERITRQVPLGPSEELEFLGYKSQFLEAMVVADGAESRAIAYQEFQDQCRLLRDRIVAEAAKADCGEPPVLVYGARLPRATAIVPDTRPRQCHTLIHATNPESPEDLYLRELNIRCDRIIRYRVAVLDDAAWARQNEPLRWPLAASDLRELAYARLTAMLC